MSSSHARRRFCRDCGFTIRTGKSDCPSCGSTRTPSVGEFVAPTIAANVPWVNPPHPWNNLVWPEGATLSLAAPQGLGKSSVSMLFNKAGPAKKAGLHIGAWFSTEQDPYQVSSLATRLEVPCPPIWPVNPSDAFADAKRGLEQLALAAGAVIVFDSLTPLGLQDAVRMMNLLIVFAREEGWRICMINQTNKAEQVAGSASLVFMPDITVNLTTDKFGRRRLFVGKNRYGTEYTRYYTFDREGKVVLPQFQGIVHSVEGKGTDLELVPYGLADGSIPGVPGQARGKKVQWASILDPLAPFGLLPRFAGYATAGAESAASEFGFMHPPDVDARRTFAEEHGMKWLPMEEIYAALAPTAWRPLAVRLAAKAKKKFAALEGEGDNPPPPSGDDEPYPDDDDPYADSEEEMSATA